MIIGISGHIGSGKDTVADIIQYLSIADFEGIKALYDIRGKPLTIEEHFEWFRERKKLNAIDEVSWKIKRFADKLKDCVCLLIGCTREQLEDRKFKEKPLGEEWVKYRVWGANGHFDKYYSNHEDAWTRYNQFSKENAHFAKVELTPRLILQLLGTECGRDIIHPNVWVNALFADYEDTAVRENGSILTKRSIFPNWAIPDVRFPNEAIAIEERKGLLIRVEREEFIYYNKLDDLYERHFKEQSNINLTLVTKDEHIEYFKSIHESETALDNFQGFHYVINNDGTIEDLIKEVKKILLLEGIINE